MTPKNARQTREIVAPYVTALQTLANHLSVVNHRSAKQAGQLDLLQKRFERFEQLSFAGRLYWLFTGRIYQKTPKPAPTLVQATATETIALPHAHAAV